MRLTETWLWFLRAVSTELLRMKRDVSCLRQRDSLGLMVLSSLVIGAMALAFLEIRSWFQSFIFNVEGNVQYIHLGWLWKKEARRLGGHASQNRGVVGMRQNGKSISWPQGLMNSSPSHQRT